ncbi:MAG: hypothetical protein KatS3mg101_1091 [Patescibacteria group bacterium]|nr:MAG: hypothetical protein KatS3mg101_1091 [Patescibacteria group bacterium]
MQYEQIKTLKKQVEFILKNYPHTRNDDRELVKIVCERFGHDPIAKATSIERCRRWLNQRGEYLPTDERVARQRKMNIEEWRVSMGYRTTGGTYTPPSEANKPKEWLIPSETRRGVFYRVIDFGYRMECECPQFRFKRTCKHLKKAIQRSILEKQNSLFNGTENINHSKQYTNTEHYN